MRWPLVWAMARSVSRPSNQAQPEAIRGTHTARVMSTLSLGAASSADASGTLVEQLRALPADVLRQLLQDLRKTPAK